MVLYSMSTLFDTLARTFFFPFFSLFFSYRRWPLRQTSCFNTVSRLASGRLGARFGTPRRGRPENKQVSFPSKEKKRLHIRCGAPKVVLS